MSDGCVDLKGEFDWHTHVDTDELFLVVEAAVEAI